MEPDDVLVQRDPDGQLKLYHRTVGDRVYDLRSDELYLDEDAIGNTKIDELGYLKGGAFMGGLISAQRRL